MTVVRTYRAAGHKVNWAPASAMPTFKGQGHGRGAASGGPRTPEHPPQAIARTPKLKGQSCNSPHGGEEHRENDPGGGQVAEMLQESPAQQCISDQHTRSITPTVIRKMRDGRTNLLLFRFEPDDFSDGALISAKDAGLRWRVAGGRDLDSKRAVLSIE
jgi:hypothetical protein